MLQSTPLYHALCAAAWVNSPPDPRFRYTRGGSSGGLAHGDRRARHRNNPRTGSDDRDARSHRIAAVAHGPEGVGPGWAQSAARRDEAAARDLTSHRLLTAAGEWRHGVPLYTSTADLQRVMFGKSFYVRIFF